MKIQFTTIENWKRQAADDQLSWLGNNATLSDRDREAYRAGFLQGWKELEKTLKAQGLLAVDMKR